MFGEHVGESPRRFKSCPLRMASLTEEIKNRLDIVDFINSYITLRKTGKNYSCLCPFHKETKPSFFVSPDKQFWHCFSCSAGGDIIKFLMLYENLEFPQALRILAEKAGLDIRQFSSVDQKQVNLLLDINQKAKDFFKENLKKNPEVNNYLFKRGLNKKTIEEFELGFANRGDNLTFYLNEQGFSPSEVEKAGLCSKRQGKYQDFFQNRIIFPLCDRFSKIIGFCGRVVQEKDEPKYLNSPETAIFKKSKVLYGFDKSKAEINKTKTALLVEGHLDFLMSWQSGIENTVATAGTALTIDHLIILKRFADKLVICFDKDEAGIKALERQLDNLLSLDFNIDVLDLENFKDPAEAALENPSFLKEALKKTKPVFSFLFDFYLQETNWEIRKKNIFHLLERIKKIENQVEQAHWLKELSLKSGIEEKTLNIELSKAKLPRSQINSREGLAKQEQEITFETKKISRIEAISEKLLSLAVLEEKFSKELENHSSFLAKKLSDLEEKEKEFLFHKVPLGLQASHEFGHLEQEELTALFNELLKELKIEFFKNEGYKLKKEIKLLQENKDLKNLEKVLKKFQTIHQNINELQKKQKH